MLTKSQRIVDFVAPAYQQNHGIRQILEFYRITVKVTTCKKTVVLWWSHFSNEILAWVFTFCPSLSKSSQLADGVYILKYEKQNRVALLSPLSPLVPVTWCSLGVQVIVNRCCPRAIRRMMLKYSRSTLSAFRMLNLHYLPLFISCPEWRWVWGVRDIETVCDTWLSVIDIVKFRLLGIRNLIRERTPSDTGDISSYGGFPARSTLLANCFVHYVTLYFRLSFLWMVQCR